jgi:hypothetical protein
MCPIYCPPAKLILHFYVSYIPKKFKFLQKNNLLVVIFWNKGSLSDAKSQLKYFKCTENQQSTLWHQVKLFKFISVL